MKGSLIYPIGGNEWNEAMEIDHITNISVNLDDRDIFVIEFMVGGEKRTETLNFKDFPKGTILEVSVGMGRRTKHEGK